MVGPDLAADLDLSAAGLGLLTSAYLFAFALFQLPLGVLLDRFGPRRVQAALLACAAAGSLLFALGQGIATLASARALIGLGFAGGLMSGFKAVVLWVPEPRRALAKPPSCRSARSASWSPRCRPSSRSRRSAGVRCSSLWRRSRSRSRR